MRATDHLKMIKANVDRIHSENNISIDVAFVWMTPSCASITGKPMRP
jgi:hypothetical protein